MSASSLEEAERLWVLKALDVRWQRHIATMTVLRNSVNLRAFGLLEPLEEYNVDGARAFAQFVRDVRLRAVQYLFFFVDALEPTLLEEEQQWTGDDGEGAGSEEPQESLTQ